MVVCNVDDALMGELLDRGTADNNEVISQRVNDPSLPPVNKLTDPAFDLLKISELNIFPC